MNRPYHIPVLLQQTIELLVTEPNGIYVDVTFGGGGHSRAILERLSNQGRLIAFDQDPDNTNAQIKDERFLFMPANFRYIKQFLQYHKAYPVTGILADLGVSSHQIDSPERGFSYRFDSPLDMRMNQGKGVGAAEILNNYPETKLAEIFFKYGELANGRRIANKITNSRIEKPIETTTDLVEITSALFPKHKQNKYLSQLFQALRIEVNKEMEVLEEFLMQTPEALAPQGRLAVISYHSLEDRLVKNFMRSGNFKGEVEKDFFGNPLTPFKLISGKAILPDEDELKENPRSRSAKLRIAEKK